MKIKKISKILCLIAAFSVFTPHVVTPVFSAPTIRRTRTSGNDTTLGDYRISEGGRSMHFTVSISRQSAGKRFYKVSIFGKSNIIIAKDITASQVEGVMIGYFSSHQ